MESNIAFLGELERIFKEEFLKAAPLYVASSKIKLPYEDLHRPTPMYSGSLKEVTRQVNLLADYETFKTDPEAEELIEWAGTFGHQAGIYVDGCIRAENIREVVGCDPRDVRNVKVIDVFEHTDGRRNLQIYFVQSSSTVASPTVDWKACFGYKFVFACAAIVLEYKKQA